VGIGLARFYGSATTVCQTLLTLECRPDANVLAAYVFVYQPHILLLPFVSYFPVFLLTLRVSVHQKWTVVTRQRDFLWNVPVFGGKKRKKKDFYIPDVVFTIKKL
jgi:hypothetical protein